MHNIRCTSAYIASMSGIGLHAGSDPGVGFVTGSDYDMMCVHFLHTHLSGVHHMIACMLSESWTTGSFKCM